MPQRVLKLNNGLKVSQINLAGLLYQHLSVFISLVSMGLFGCSQASTNASKGLSQPQGDKDEALAVVKAFERHTKQHSFYSLYFDGAAS